MVSSLPPVFARVPNSTGCPAFISLLALRSSLLCCRHLRNAAVLCFPVSPFEASCLVGSVEVYAGAGGCCLTSLPEFFPFAPPGCCTACDASSTALNQRHLLYKRV